MGEYGKINLGIDVKNEISVNSRAAATAEELANFNLNIIQGADTKWTGTYRSFFLETIYFPASTGYVVHAESCTETEAQTANDNWGQLRVAGQSDLFEVIANQNTQVDFTCTVQNAKVGIAYDASFTSTFTNVSVEMYETSDEERKLIFPSQATFDTHTAYFNIDATPEITYTIKGTFNQIEKTYKRTLAIEKAKWYRLTISTTSHGEI